MKRFVLALAIVLGSPVARAQTDAPPDDQAQLIAWPRIFELRAALGASVASGGTASGDAQYAFFGTGRLDLATVDAVAVRAWLGRLEIGGRPPSHGGVWLGLLSVDEAIIGTHHTLGQDGKLASQPCIYLINAPCVADGHFGFGLDLVQWQYSTDTERNALRVGEATFVFSPEAAYASSGTGGATSDATWMTRHFPMRVGASADYFYGGPVTNGWVGRFVVGVDALVRFAGQHGELEARFRYRPSFTAWTDDYGIEASLYIGYGGAYTLLQHQGAPWRLGLEVGYAYWSEPLHSFGLTWDEIGRNTGFARVIFQPALAAVR